MKKTSSFPLLLKGLLLICLLTGNAVPSCAGDDVHEPNDSIKYHYFVNEDGSVDITTTIIQKQETPLSNEKMQFTPFVHEQLNNMQVQDAWIERQGKRVADLATEILWRENAVGFGLLAVNLAEVQPGDYMHMQLKEISHVQSIPGKLHHTLIFENIGNDEHLGQAVEVIVDAPRELSVQFDAVGLINTSFTRTNERNLWQWRGSLKKLQPDPKDLSAEEFLPRLAMSGYGSIGELARAEFKQLETENHASETVQTEAWRIVSHIDSRREKAAALYRWVRDIVKYGDISPARNMAASPEKTILSKRGECKSKTVLLEALLAAIGIPSEPVVVSVKRYWQPSVPAFGSDHALLFVPEFDVYLDATSKAEFGSPLEFLSDRKLLHLRQGLVRHMPYIDAETNTTSNEVSMSVSPDMRRVIGHSTSLISSTWGGLQDAAISYQNDKDNDKSIKHVEDMLRVSRLDGTGSFELKSRHPMEVDAKFSFDIPMLKNDLLPIPEGFAFSAIAMEPVLAEKYAIDGFWYCKPKRIRSVSTLSFPAMLKTARLPGNVKVGNQVAQYTATYTLHAPNKIVAERAFKFDAGHHICSRTDTFLYREITRVIRDDLNAMIQIAQGE